MSSPLAAPSTLAFLRLEWRFLLFGLLVAFWSSPGQTFVISLFGARIREEFGLSHGDFGALYMVGTLASAALLLPAGRLIDRLPLERFTRWVVLGMSLAAGAFSLVAGPLTLCLGVFALRFTGQGLMTHIALTAMARRYRRERGRALAVAGFGHPLGEALFPPLVVAALALMEWRLVWLLLSLAVALCLLPALPALLRRTGSQDGAGASALGDGGPGVRDWTRGEMLRDPRFYLLVPAAMAQSAIGTGIFFHQVHLVAVKGWDLAWWSLCFSFYAAASVGAGLAAGFLIDRFGGRTLAPLSLLPFALSLLLFSQAEAAILAAPFMVLMGLSAGGHGSVLAAMWAELYGTRHLGAIRAVAACLMVFGSALGPLFMGWPLDAGVSLAAIALTGLALTLLACALAAAALWRGDSQAG